MKLSVLFSIISVIVAITLVSLVNTDNTRPRGTIELVSTEVTNLDTRRYDQTGALLEQTSTRHLIQYDQDDRLKLSEVTVTQVTPSGEMWTLTAPKGIAYDTTNALELSAGVEISNQNATTLTTDKVFIDTSQRLATSDDQVLLVTPKSRTQASGLTINLEQGSATLRGNVRTNYQASSN